jgi:hypothetical protein
MLAFLQPLATRTDKALEHAMGFVLRHRHTKAARLSIMAEGPDAKAILDSSWMPPRRWHAGTGRPRRDVPMLTVERQYLALGVLSCAVTALKSGDLYIAGREQCSDYRDPLVTWEAYAQLAPTYCAQVGLSPDAETLVRALHTWLTETIQATDAAFPTNTSWSIHAGEPVGRKLEKAPEPEGCAVLDRLLSERMPECSIVDVLTDTEPWLHWTAAFGPLSGLESRLVAPRQRYITTPCCDGCDLGPTQTARAVASVDRRHGAYVNQYHSTAQKLLDAIVGVINR